MGWREAYLAQAKSDFGIFHGFGGDVAVCHRLHYLQMLTEKLAKGLLVGAGDGQPTEMTHIVFVRMLQTLKGNTKVRHRLGYRDNKSYRAFIDSLLELARQIEQLAPSSAELTRPNPEYPWQDRITKRVFAPEEYHFPTIDREGPTMAKLLKLIHDLLQLAT